MSGETQTPIETDVLVVGAGPAGASAGVMLAEYGVDVIVLNKYSHTSPTPRAHITNQRCMEVFRDLGFERRVNELATPQHLMGEHVFATSLAGEELGRNRTWYTHPVSKANHDLASPCSVCDIPQDVLEPILIDEATSRGAKVRFNTEYLSHIQDEAGVTAEVRDRLTGTTYTIRAKYMIGADGGRSLVAEHLNLPLEGKMGLGGSMSIMFKADLSRFVTHRPGVMYWMIQPGTGFNGSGIGVLRVVHTWDRWVATWGFDITRGEPDLSDKEAKAIVMRLIGDDSVEVEVESYATWTINDVHATQNMRGRVVCVGDAVHRHPPMNGLGSNTSIQDSFNVCWKLALLVKGQGGPDLLESYNDERVPVGRQIVKRANDSVPMVAPILFSLGLESAPDAEAMAEKIAARAEATPEGAEKRAKLADAIRTAQIGFNTLGAEANQRYVSEVISLEPEGHAPFEVDEDYYHTPSPRPGAHLPHVWLTKTGHRVSSLDLCGRGRFTLLTGISGVAWQGYGQKVSEELGLDLTVYVIGPHQVYEDIYGDFARMREIEESGAILVRPDLIIAWRAQALYASAQSDLQVALAKAVGRGEAQGLAAAAE